MLDGFKLAISLDREEEKILRKKISWEVTYESENEELMDVIRTRKEYKGLFFKLVKKEGGFNLTINGNFNKFLNGDNSKNLSYKELLLSIGKLCAFVGVPPHRAKILHLEFGVGIYTSIPAGEIVENIILHKTRKPTLIKDEKRGDYIRFQGDEFLVKAYDRGIWLGIGIFHLAVEIKGLKARFLNGFCIYSLADLTQQNLARAAERLIQVCKDLLIFDPRLNIEVLSDSQQIFLYRFRNPKEWRKIKNRTSHYNARKKFRKITATCIAEPISDEIVRLVRNETDIFFKIKHMGIFSKFYSLPLLVLRNSYYQFGMLNSHIVRFQP